MILDDDGDSQAALAAAVGAAGHQVVACGSSVREMVQQSLSLTPDVVIADLGTLMKRSPEGPSGWRVRPRLPILGICDAREQDLAAWCIEHEPLIQAILVRPVDPVHLRPAIPLAVQRFAECEALKRTVRQLCRRLETGRSIGHSPPQRVPEVGSTTVSRPASAAAQHTGRRSRPDN